MPVDTAQSILGAVSSRNKAFLRLALISLLPAVLCVWAPAAPASALAAATESSLPVPEASAVETRMNGRIFGVDPRLGHYSCSGTALNTPSHSIVLTAGHCVHEGGRWGRNIVFVPAFDHGARPFGTYSAEAVFTTPQWRKLENPDFDVAAIEVRPNRLGPLTDVVGAHEWTSGRSRSSSFQVFGYPAGALAGETMRRCESMGLGSDPITNAFPGPPTVGVRCDMAGGASGGPWLVEGRVDGVTSYGYRNHFGRIFSPYFGPAIARFLSGLP